MQNIKIKKRQFVVIQLSEKDLTINAKGEVIAKPDKYNFVQTSATTILRQIEKIELENKVHKSIKRLNELLTKMDSREFKADAFVKFTSIEFGKVTKENEE